MLSADKTKAKSSKRNGSREKPISSSTVEVADYRHKGEKRKNVPDAGLAIYNYKPQEPVKYSYDPHLDPQLVWTGKAERPSFEVETVSLHIHERVSTQAILTSVQKAEQYRQLRLFAEPDMPLNKRIEFYQHEMDWTNRLILGDSLLVMNSLKERELMEGKVQMIYMDPPYGINYSSNFQPSIAKHDVKDKDDDFTREPEQIKVYRDTWTLGIHSYLAYLRDRLLLCKDLLTESGSIFVQISDVNLHHVCEIMDEIFGRQNRLSVIVLQKTTSATATRLATVCDFLLWYAKNATKTKYHQLFWIKRIEVEGQAYNKLIGPNGEIRGVTAKDRKEGLPKGWKLGKYADLTSDSPGSRYPVEFKGRTYWPGGQSYWKTDKQGMARLMAATGRLSATDTTLYYVRQWDDFAGVEFNNVWTDVAIGGFGDPKIYAVQTNSKIIERCLLMTTDPGDLILDPTCGSGTTAYVAEKCGRRWITCDTSRVAIAIARQRLMTARFDYYKFANPESGVDSGFQYETLPHTTLSSIAQSDLPETEILRDKPIIEGNMIRVSGPFTVEAIPAPTVPEQNTKSSQASTTVAVDYTDVTIDLLQKSGVTFPGGKHMTIENLRPTSSASFVHAEGEAKQNGDKVRIAVSLGPRYGPITAKQVDEAMRSAYKMGFDLLVFAGFAFEPEAQATIQKSPIPKLVVQMAHISPDVIVGAYSNSPLLKTTKTSQLFTVFGEPDVKLERHKDECKVRLLGVDLYDPTTGEVHSSSAGEVPAWFLDEDYDGYTFRICQAFFPKEATATNPWDKLENALRGVVDREKMETFRGTESLPFKVGEQKQIAVKVIDIRGNEVMVVKSLNSKETT